MLHRRVRALGVTLATILLAGCVPFLPLPGPDGGALQEISSIIGGECFRLSEIGGEVGVDLTKAVACTEEHEVEIIRTVVVPARLATLSAEEAA